MTCLTRDFNVIEFVFTGIVDVEKRRDDVEKRIDDVENKISGVEKKISNITVQIEKDFESISKLNDKDDLSARY